MDRRRELTLSRLLSREEAADYLGLKPQTLAAWAHQGQGPPYLKLGRAVRYDQTDLDGWLAERRVLADREYSN